MGAATTQRSAATASTYAGSRTRRRRPADVPSMAFDALFDTEAPDGAAAHGHPVGAAVMDRSAEGQTLDQFLAGVWEDLSAHRAVTCPVCRASAAMRPRYGAGQGAVGGRCDDCGSVVG